MWGSSIDSRALTPMDFEMTDCARLCRELMSLTKKCQLVLVDVIYVDRCYRWHFVYNFRVHYLPGIFKWQIVRNSVSDSSVTEFFTTKTCQLVSVFVMNVHRVFRWHFVKNFELHLLSGISNWQIVRGSVSHSSALFFRDFEMTDCAKFRKRFKCH